MNRNSEAGFKKKHTHRKKKVMVLRGVLASAQPLTARITDDGRAFVATILNGRGIGDFVRLFATDLDELRLRLSQNQIAEV